MVIHVRAVCGKNWFSTMPSVCVIICLNGILCSCTNACSSCMLMYPCIHRRLVTISVVCTFNHRAPYAMYCFCWLSGLTWVVWACIAAYGKRALIRIRDQPPLHMLCECTLQLGCGLGLQGLITCSDSPVQSLWIGLPCSGRKCQRNTWSGSSQSHCFQHHQTGG